MEFDVFISYSRADEEFAIALRDVLEKKGVKCWRDKENIGFGNWAEKIVEAIDTAPIMVLIFSSKAQGSENVLKELTLAAQNKRYVIPVRIEDVIAAGAFRYHLATPNVIDVFDRPKEKLERIADDINNLIHRFKQQTAVSASITDKTTSWKKYESLLRTSLSDGKIIPEERTMLISMAQILGLSDEETKDIEKKVRNELGIPEETASHSIIKQEPFQEIGHTRETLSKDLSAVGQSPQPRIVPKDEHNRLLPSLIWPKYGTSFCLITIK